MRTFIAVEIPSQLRSRLTSVRAKLATLLADNNAASSLRWSGEYNYHLTLRFLGDTTDAQRRCVGKMLDEVAAGSAPFSLELTGLGAFPNWRKMGVLWVGVAGDVPSLHSLQAAVEAGVQTCGFAAESRAFHPHATLARVRPGIKRSAFKTQIAQAGALLAAQTKVAQQLGHWTVSELVLMRSDLQPGGMVYSRLGRFRLAA
jgi:2'-5' RNA ligase